MIQHHSLPDSGTSLAAAAAGKLFTGVDNHDTVSDNVIKNLATSPPYCEGTIVCLSIKSFTQLRILAG